MGHLPDSSDRTTYTNHASHYPHMTTRLRMNLSPATIVAPGLNVVKVKDKEKEMDYYTVIKPVVNLRAEPVPAVVPYSHDELQETQLLFNEKVLVKGEEGGWFYVEAVEQETFRKTGEWQGYPGWVEKESLESWADRAGMESGVVKTATAPVFPNPDGLMAPLFSLSMGTWVSLDPSGTPHSRCWPILIGSGRRGWIDRDCLRMAAENRLIDEETCRRDLVAGGRLFLGTPYLWGGRSMYMPDLLDPATGVDCSGLVSILFRVFGINLPRDAHEQWMTTDPIAPDSLKPGDLVFATSREEVDHVMLFAGEEEIIEAVETGSTVRLTTFRERFGVPRAGLTSLPYEEGALMIFCRRAPL